MNLDDPELRLLLDRALLGLSPSPDARARARERLLSLGPPASASTEHEPEEPLVNPEETPPREHGRATFVRKSHALALLATGVLLGGVAGFAIGRSADDSKSSSAPLIQDTPTVSTVTTPARTLASLEIEPIVKAPLAAPTPSAHNPHDRQVKAVRESRDAGRLEPPVAQTRKSDGDDEVLWVQRVRKALAKGEAQLALALLHELDVKIPAGRLAEERAAGKTLGRCMLRPHDGASEVQKFASQYPDSVHLPRVTHSCGHSP